jgi:hypothetical protein
MPSSIWEKWDELSETLPSRAKVVADDAIEGWGAVFFHPAIELWMLITFAFMSYYAGRFAVKRLILHPNPPEVEIQ